MFLQGEAGVCFGAGAQAAKRNGAACGRWWREGRRGLVDRQDRMQAGRQAGRAGQGRAGCRQGVLAGRVRRAGRTEADGVQVLCAPGLARRTHFTQETRPTNGGEPTGDVGQPSHQALPNRFCAAAGLAQAECT